MTRPAPDGTVYLLHFARPIGNLSSRTGYAQHYIGWTRDLDARLTEHRDGQGARILAAVTAAGISWTLARTWPGTRARERSLKRQGGAARSCPECGRPPRGQPSGPE